MSAFASSCELVLCQLSGLNSRRLVQIAGIATSASTVVTTMRPVTRMRRRLEIPAGLAGGLVSGSLIALEANRHHSLAGGHRPNGGKDAAGRAGRVAIEDPVNDQPRGNARGRSFRPPGGSGGGGAA